MQITYATRNLEKYFTDFDKLRKKLPFDWVKSIKKYLDWFSASECFGDFLKLGLGKPERLSGYKEITYSLHVSANARLIVELNATEDSIKLCTEIEIEGVCDYHGRKNNWYIWGFDISPWSNIIRDNGKQRYFTSGTSYSYRSFFCVY